MTENDPQTPPAQIDIDGNDTPAPQVDTGPDVKPAPVKGKRPTTRAGRAAKAAERARKAQSKPAAEKKPAQGRTARTSPLGSRLNGAIVGVGSALTISGAMMGSEPLIADGSVVQMHAQPLSDALEKLAQNDPRVRAALERMLTAGAYGGLIAAVMPIALGIMANHNMIPAQLAGMTGPPPAQPSGLPDDAFSTRPAA